MTVAATVTRELNINQICKNALRLAGVLEVHQEVDEADGSAMRDFLETTVDALQSKGIIARTQSTYLLTLTSGTYIYSLPSNVLDVIGNGAYIAASEADVTKASGETPVVPMDLATWQGLPSKNATGRPFRFYAHREATLVSVYLWPIPDEAGRIRLRTVRLLADNNDGAATVDLERPWSEYLLYALAHKAALYKSQNLAKATYFENLADKALAQCIAFANEHVDVQVTLDHPTAWSR